MTSPQATPAPAGAAALERAVERAGTLKVCLAREVDAARGVRDALCTLDTDVLLSGAEGRRRFLETCGRLQDGLARDLAEAADALGLGSCTLHALETACPEAGGRLAEALSEVGALAGALSELDALNRTLGDRALAVVGGWLSALAPTGQVYDRTGLLRPGAAVTRTASWRV